MGIRAKIVLPFTILFLATIVAVALLAARATAHLVDERIQAQMADLAGVLSQARFAVNPSVLRHVKAIMGGELATVDSRGTLVATTLEPPTAAAFREHLEGTRQAVGDRAAPTWRVNLGGRAYRATFAPVELAYGQPAPAFVYLLTPEAEIQAATRRAVQPIIVAAACGALAVIVLGYVVGQRLARPVESLASQARQLAAGHSDAPLAVRTHDEVGRLAAAFNALLESLREAERRLIASERLAAVGQVAAGIAHEVRNPLSGIKMSAQVLKRRLGELDRKVEESADIMLAEVSRLEVIIDDLLTFACPTALRAEPGDLSLVVGEVLDFMARQLEHAGIAVRRELDPRLPPARLDPQRIRQVVLNLVLNAAEAMPNGGTLTGRTRCTEGEVVAELDDTGHGIAPEIAEKVFEPFFTTKRGGSGLGLGVSRTIVEAHGGKLWFEPRARGSRFIFSLPRAAGGARSLGPEIANRKSEIENGQNRGH